MWNINLKNERIGLVNSNNYGSTMKIITYNNATDVFVIFEQGEPVHTSWDSFIKGKVRNVYDKTVYGIGYIGEGEFITSINGKKTRCYKTWYDMLKRCYSAKYHEKYPTYKGCTVTDEWHNFQIFAKWYNENYYDIEGEKMNLDKDILIKGNKIYSPETCVFLPQTINKLFEKCDAKRGNLPIGVHFDKSRNKFKATCSNNRGSTVNIGRYDSAEEAYKAYKTIKEKLIKQIAEEYRGRIPEWLYNSMLKYEVHIED